MHDPYFYTKEELSAELTSLDREIQYAFKHVPRSFRRYFKSLINLCHEYHFYISVTVIKVVKNLIFQKSLTSH